MSPGPRLRVPAFEVSMQDESITIIADQLWLSFGLMMMNFNPIAALNCLSHVVFKVFETMPFYFSKSNFSW